MGKKKKANEAETVEVNEIEAEPIDDMRYSLHRAGIDCKKFSDQEVVESYSKRWGKTYGEDTKGNILVPMLAS